MHKLVVSLAALGVLLANCILPTESTICCVDPSDDFHERMPLILKADADEFVYPNKCGSKTLLLTIKDNLRAACPADTIRVFGSNTKLAVAKLSCYGITLFGLGGTSYAAPFRRIRCNRIPEAEVQATNTTCVNGTISRVGFAISSTSFVPTIDEICVNSTVRTQWTHHKVVAGLTKAQRLPLLGGAAAASGDGADNWWASDLLDGWFSKPTTTTTTPSPTVDNELITTMMVPREDMFFRAQQDSVTKALINTVPMFKSVRNGNWRLVEDIVRKIASTKKRCATLDVWTGRYDGNATSVKGRQRQAREITTTTQAAITTTQAATTTTQAATTTTQAATTTTQATTTTTATSTTSVAPETYTTPRFVFKMVVDKTRNRGLVFVTDSDPTVTAVTPAQQLCTPYARCSQLYPQFNVVSRGYTHCCTLDAFASIASEMGLPTFPKAQPLF